MNIQRKLALVATVPAMIMATGAHATLDTAVTDAITTAQTNLLAMYAALTAAGVVIWVARLIYRKFSVK